MHRLGISGRSGSPGVQVARPHALPWGRSFTWLSSGSLIGAVAPIALGCAAAPVPQKSPVALPQAVAEQPAKSEPELPPLTPPPPATPQFFQRVDLERLVRGITRGTEISLDAESLLKSGI